MKPILICLALAGMVIFCESLLASPPDDQAAAEATVAKVDALINRTSKAVNDAKTPEDLDGILRELEKFQNDQTNFLTPESQSAHQRISNALEFTKIWQSLLSHESTQQWELARNDLESLSQGNYGMEIIPRSRILALLAPKPQKEQAQPEQPETQQNYEAEAYQIVGDIQKLDDLVPAYKKLKDLQQSGHFTQAYVYLKPVADAYIDVKDGLPANVASELNSDTHDALRPEVHKELLLFFLHHLFSAYNGAPPSAAETPDSYVDRVSHDAVKQQDWNLLKLSLAAYKYLHSASKLPFNDAQNTLDGMDELLAGMNQEDAGQYNLAVASYQNALKQLPGSLVPPKIIGDRLASIKANHPTDYDQGMLYFLAPPTSHPFFNGIPGYGMPGYPPMPSRPSLYIPGARQPTPPTPNSTPTHQPPVMPASGDTTAPPTKSTPPTTE